jgi:hypothetical protein
MWVAIEHGRSDKHGLVAATEHDVLVLVAKFIVDHIVERTPCGDNYQHNAWVLERRQRVQEHFLAGEYMELVTLVEEDGFFYVTFAEVK